MSSLSGFTEKVQIDAEKGIDFAIRACNGSGDAMGYPQACWNLANIYERGNRKLGIARDEEKMKEYRFKAFLHTQEGKMQVAVTNMPTAGKTY